MNEKEQRNHDLQERLVEFAIRLLNVVESLPNSRVGNHHRTEEPRSLSEKKSLPSLTIDLGALGSTA
jgi:hypothetical protein